VRGKKGEAMAKFLFKASYTTDGIAGVIREGGSGRAKAIDALADSVGGSIESIYWAFGETDVYLIGELPDAIAAGALSAKVAASGQVTITTTPLFTADDIDAMASRAQNVDYRPPGA
jgi:uncharacterized protein with GYD domain